MNRLPTNLVRAEVRLGAWSMFMLLTAGMNTGCGQLLNNGGPTEAGQVSGQTAGGGTTGDSTTSIGSTAGTTGVGSTSAGSTSAGSTTGGSSTTAGTTGTTAGTTTGASTGTTTGTTTGPVPGGTNRVTGNPFTGTVMYVNPDWSKETDLTAATLQAGSADAALVAKARSLPTAIWLDSIAAIAGGAANANRLSLQGHFSAALQQAVTAGKPASVLLVVYDLPDRDCAALASNGELHGATGLASYKSQYIDAIKAAITANADFGKLHIILVIEPDSLPNMVTNTSVAACAAVSSAGEYTQGVTYALNTLGALPNVYAYLDIAHSGWLGWPANMSGAVTLYSQLLKTLTTAGAAAVRGLATNTSNYTPLQEPFVSPSNTTLLNGSFYQSNPVWDELTYVRDLDAQFKSAGFTMGFLIDTSRNGWALVNDGNPIDRRTARGNWCNISGAGLGERPQVSPAAYGSLDAYVYIKPPGESDGSSMQVADPTKHFDPHCDSTNAANNALPNAPVAGSWFSGEFMMLLHNATPAL